MPKGESRRKHDQRTRLRRPRISLAQHQRPSTVYERRRTRETMAKHRRSVTNGKDAIRRRPTDPFGADAPVPTCALRHHSPPSRAVAPSFCSSLAVCPRRRRHLHHALKTSLSPRPRAGSPCRRCRGIERMVCRHAIRAFLALSVL